MLTDYLKNVIMSKKQLNIENTLYALYWPYPVMVITDLLLKLMGNTAVMKHVRYCFCKYTTKPQTMY